jgi:type II secretory ATPase GspE/PulE/Tfp pilus assembly ATPase PilB-like protein
MEELMRAWEKSTRTLTSRRFARCYRRGPIIRLVNSTLFRQSNRRQDIHIEPFEKELIIRFRIDGVLYDIMHPPKRAQNSIFRASRSWRV